MSKENIIFSPQNTAGKTAVRKSFSTPAADIWDDRDGYTIEVEMPGVNKANVEVSIEDGKLVVIGHRQREEEHCTTEVSPCREDEKGEVYRRVFDLSPEVDVASLQAKLVDGLLSIAMRKSEIVKPRRISVA